MGLGFGLGMAATTLEHTLATASSAEPRPLALLPPPPPLSLPPPPPLPPPLSPPPPSTSLRLSYATNCTEPRDQG